MDGLLKDIRYATVAGLLGSAPAWQARISKDSVDTTQRIYKHRNPQFEIRSRQSAV